jgi:hypothetical protein
MALQPDGHRPRGEAQPVDSHARPEAEDSNSVWEPTALQARPDAPQRLQAAPRQARLALPQRAPKALRLRGPREQWDVLPRSQPALLQPVLLEQRAVSVPAV